MFQRLRRQCSRAPASEIQCRPTQTPHPDDTGEIIGMATTVSDFEGAYPDCTPRFCQPLRWRTVGGARESWRSKLRIILANVACDWSDPKSSGSGRESSAWLAVRHNRLMPRQAFIACSQIC
jgi:hypothetical protein